MRGEKRSNSLERFHACNQKKSSSFESDCRKLFPWKIDDKFIITETNKNESGVIFSEARAFRAYNDGQ